jgi:hypothetical protein
MAAGCGRKLVAEAGIDLGFAQADRPATAPSAAKLRRVSFGFPKMSEVRTGAKRREVSQPARGGWCRGVSEWSNPTQSGVFGINIDHNSVVIAVVTAGDRYTPQGDPGILRVGQRRCSAALDRWVSTCVTSCATTTDIAPTALAARTAPHGRVATFIKDSRICRRITKT